MLRMLARIWARTSYIFQLETESAKSSINSKIAAQNAETSRKLVAQVNAEADGIDKNIEAEQARLEKGYWECECGKDNFDAPAVLQDEGHFIHCECGKPMKLVKLSEMTGQEKYELEKQKKDAQTVASEKRKLAEQEVENVTNREQTAKMLAGNAESARSFADKIRRL